MPIISVRIPQLGEGLQEARVVEFLKQPGDEVKRDEPIYSMETDKAVTDVESPYDGKLVEWLVDVDTVQPIGADIAKMEVAEGVEEMQVGHGTSGPGGPTSLSGAPAAGEMARNRQIPPRTRRYLKEHGLLEQAHLIPSKGNKLMPEDVDAYLAAGHGGEEVQADPYEEHEVPKAQQTLSYRLVRGGQQTVEVSIIQRVDWSAIEAARDKLKNAGGDFQPSAFTLMLWCVAKAMEKHPKFRSILSGDGTILRTYKHVNLGIAVALPDDLLMTAVVHAAETLDFPDFCAAVKKQISLAREGQDQATNSTTLSVSNMGSLGMWCGIPAVVSPAPATMVLGEVVDHAVPAGDGFRFIKQAVLTLTFDHRAINGVGGAEFMAEVQKNIEGFELPG